MQTFVDFRDGLVKYPDLFSLAFKLTGDQQIKTKEQLI